jgi:FkbM family methyltransferase
MAVALHTVPAPLVTSLRSFPVVARLIRPLVNRLLPTQPTAVTVRSGVGAGLRLVINPQTEKFFWAGDHEVAVQQELADTLRPGMSFWDVGAHAGFFTIIAGRQVGEGGRVHAFEPMSDTRARLQSSVAQSGLTNTTVHDCAISSQGEPVTIYEHQHSAVASLVRGDDAVAGWDVHSSTLDEMAAEVGNPDVIKIDVEGVEVDILRGGRELLSRRTSRMIVEFSNETVLQEARRLLPFHGFRQLDERHWVLR